MEIIPMILSEGGGIPSICAMVGENWATMGLLPGMFSTPPLVNDRNMH